MQIDKVVLRSILNTLAAIAVLFVSLMLTLILIFPSTMMGISYDLGMDNAAVYFAKTAYKRSGEVYYIAFATETAIGVKNTEKIDACGELLILDDEFSDYCAAQDDKLSAKSGTYRNYIYSNYCLAVYEEESGAKAAQIAIEETGNSFTKGNPVSVVLVYAMSKNEKDVVQTLYTAMQAITVSDDSEAASLNELMQFASSYLSE